MLKQNNYIKQIIENKSEKGGFIKQESEIYKEFEEFCQREDKDSSERIITFTPYSEPQNEDAPEYNSFAAKSAPGVTNIQKESFFIFPEKDIALKLNKKNDKETFASIIATNDFDSKDTILYCNDLNKYFLPDNHNEFHLGNLNNFDTSKMLFSSISPFGSIEISYSGEGYKLNSQSDFLKIKDIIINQFDVEIELESEIELRAAKIIIGDYIDFLKIQEGKIVISKVILSGFFKIVLY